MTPPNTFVYDCIKQFSDGDMISYAHLQPQLERLETSYGMWSYRSIGDITFTLGGPLCAPEDRVSMYHKLLQQKKKPILFYLTEDALEFVKESSLYVVGIGVNRRIDTPIFLQNPSKKVKSACKKSRKGGVVWEEIFDEQVVLSSLSRISNSYLNNSQYQQEMSFINMPLQCGFATHRRLFVIRGRDTHMLGFVYLNPIYKKGRLVGFLLDMLRFIKTKIWGLWFSTVYTLAQVLQREGLELYLGFCPLHDIKIPKNNHSKTLQAQMIAISQTFQSVQYIKNLREMKEEIEGYNTPRFMASYTRSLPTSLGVFMKAMNIDPTQTNPDSRVVQVIWNMLMLGRKT
jgi:lysylphosphatidylglycerol synthetase-like protein (DUF2156 family)